MSKPPVRSGKEIVDCMYDTMLEQIKAKAIDGMKDYITVPMIKAGMSVAMYGSTNIGICKAVLNNITDPMEPDESTYLAELVADICIAKVEYMIVTTSSYKPL